MAERSGPRTKPLLRRTQAMPPPRESAAERKRRERAVAAATVQVEYIDETGRPWVVLVPAGHEDEAAQGVVVGPPDVRALGWPEPLALRLHIELYNRRILTGRDARARASEIGAALSFALRADTQAVQALYREGG